MEQDQKDSDKAAVGPTANAQMPLQDAVPVKEAQPAGIKQEEDGAGMHVEADQAADGVATAVGPPGPGGDEVPQQPAAEDAKAEPMVEDILQTDARSAAPALPAVKEESASGRVLKQATKHCRSLFGTCTP